ncbi:MAG: DUF2070 family protein [Sulfolobales archaeon]|nr:DUF2070 family protein [Sulfolobales archaeon]
MQRISREAIVRQYYRRLFLLPKTYVILITYLIIALVIGIVEAFPAIDFITYFDNVVNYLLGFTTLLFLNTLLTKSKTLNVKRVLGLTTISMGVFSIAELTFAKLVGIKGLGVLTSSGLSYIVLQVFLKHPQALTASVIPQLITYLVLNEVTVEALATYLIKAFLVQALSLSSSFVVITAIELRGRKQLGIKPISLLNSFVASWFSNDPQPIESEFEKYSESSDVLLRFALMKTQNGEKVLLTFPTIHFGPFRNVGSSRFIYHLENALGSRYQAFVFHTPCSHERNLISSSDSEELVKYINNNIDGLLNVTAGLKPCKPYVVTNDSGWEAYVIPFRTGFVAFLKNLVNGSDDLPFELWSFLDDVKGMYFYSLVDTHSSKGHPEANLEIFKDLLNRVVNNYVCEEVERFEIGYGEGYVNYLHRGLCFNKVKSVVMNFNGSKHALIYLYGNNMDIKFRELIISEVSKLGLDYVEVITPDDHSCAASFKESPYDIVSCCTDVVDVIKDVVSNAMSNMSAASIHTVDLIIRNVKLVGNKVWDMVRGLDVLGSSVVKYILASIFSMNLIPIITLINVP